MKCISTTCQKAIDFYGFHASNCPHVFCQDCYLELVRQTKLEGQIVHCSKCSIELVLYGTSDMAIVHLHPEKRHAVASDLAHNELVKRLSLLEGSVALIAEQQQQPKIGELSHWMRERHAAFNASAELHPHSIIEVVLPAAAQVKLWQQRVRKQGYLMETAHRRRKQLSALRAQLKPINRKVDAARKDSAKLSAEARTLSERLNEVTQRLRKVQRAAHCVHSRIIDESTDQDNYSRCAMLIVSWDRRVQEEKSRIKIVRQVGRQQDIATAELRESIAAGERELVRLQAAEEPEKARETVIMRKLVAARRDVATGRIVINIWALCMSVLVTLVGAMVIPQSFGFSLLRVYRHFTS